jgi:hypothetical protein
MLKSFPPDRNYMMLTLKDLIEARDYYHVHLSHLSNVVGTAVGRYLIRETDPLAGSPDAASQKSKTPRTLFNSVIRDWSWPCVLVFLKEWEQLAKFKNDPDQLVPRALYLPDGRVVPTCTVLVQDGLTPDAPDFHLSFPNSYIGGGYMTFADVQRRQHMGSIACLVGDGDLTYALANRHVAGAAGREMYTMLGGKKVRIGVSHENQVVTKPFGEMYEGWAGANVELRLDAGLIQIDDIADWTTQVASMGALEEWMDFTTDTLTLDFVGENVRAFGAASGELRGTIGALFYRYSTAGGTDYVTDFLIFPRRNDPTGTLHGDSGTLWFWEETLKEPKDKQVKIRMRPFSMEWGGQTWIENGALKRTGHFALATSLSSVCRELGVTLLRDWNTGLPEYWGAVGHYTIGFFGCDGIAGNLGKLMKANQEIVSYPLDSIKSSTKITQKGRDGLVPLADVPDRLWAHGKMIRGSADGPNHFADMDRPDPGNHNKTLLQLCQDENNIDPDFWLGYYSRVGDSGRGLLPFRVWQFFNEMVDALKKKDVNRFVAAAGICAHYVGDACQPLHMSYLFNGEPNANGSGKRGEGVHSAYEDKMLRQNSVELLNLLSTRLKNPAKIKAPKNGKEAAVRTVELMRKTFATIKPIDIVNAFAGGKDLWPLFKDGTVDVIAAGVATLRAVWQGAWDQGNGNAISASKLGAANAKALIKLYMTSTWMPSKNLKTIGPVLGLAAATGTSGGASAKKKSVHKVKAKGAAGSA